MHMQCLYIVTIAVRFIYKTPLSQYTIQVLLLCPLLLITFLFQSVKNYLKMLMSCYSFCSLHSHTHTYIIAVTKPHICISLTRAMFLHY